MRLKPSLALSVSLWRRTLKSEKWLTLTESVVVRRVIGTRTADALADFFFFLLMFSERKS